MTPPPLRLVLFDFDGVLARHSRDARLARIARLAGCSRARVAAALFDSGLEREYDSGRVDTVSYLQRLGKALECSIDEAAWIEARMVGSRADPATLELVASVATRVPVGVLTNNGPLMAEAIRGIVAPLFPMLEGRVLCSGTLGVRKPERAIFDQALVHFDARACDTLFVDDVFTNVRGARAAGLHADTVIDGKSMRKVLRRYGLA